jgi:spore germination protein
MEFIGIFFVTAAVTVHIIMLTQGQFFNILPIYNTSETTRYVMSIKDIIIPFLGIEVLTITPFTNKNGKRAKSFCVMTILCIALFYILVVESCIKIIGLKNIQTFNFGLIEAIRLIDIRLFERLDILYLTFGFAALIAGIGFVFLAVIEYSCRIFSKMKRPYVTGLAGAIIMVLSLIAVNNDDSRQLFMNVVPILGIIAAFVIPIILFVVAVVEDLGSKTN